MENIPPEMRLSQVRYDLNVNIQNSFYKEKTIMGYNYYNSNGKKTDYSSKGYSEPRTTMGLMARRRAIQVRTSGETRLKESGCVSV